MRRRLLRLLRRFPLPDRALEWKMRHRLLNQFARLLRTSEERKWIERKAHEEFMLYGPIGREAYEASVAYDKAARELRRLRRKLNKVDELIDWRIGGY